MAPIDGIEPVTPPGEPVQRAGPEVFERELFHALIVTFLAIVNATVLADASMEMRT
jgi:hypothetical protein